MKDITIPPLPFATPYVLPAGTPYEDARLVVVPTKPGVVRVDFYRANDLFKLNAKPVTAPPFALPVRIIDPGLRDVLVVGSDAAGRAVEFWTVLLPIERAAAPPALVAVPNVVGQPQAAAAAALIAAGFAVGTVTTMADAARAAGSVMLQSPGQGVLAAPGTAVSLLVSSGAGAPPIVVQPVPPPATGTFCTPQLGVGWASFPVVLPQGWTAGDLRVGPFETQTDPMVRWPDGTLREAQVTLKSDRAGQYPIAAGTEPAGAFVPVWPHAVVTFSLADGLTYKAALPSYGAGKLDTFYAGPLMNDSRAVVAATSLGGPHPTLQVLFDIRAFFDGGWRVDACLQTSADNAQGGPVAYDVTLTVEGVVRYTRMGVTQAYLTRGRLPRVLVNLVEAEVAQDFEPFFLAGALARYLPSVADTRYPAPTGPKFDLLGYGDLSVDMGAPGGRLEIAPEPDPHAKYQVRKRAEQRAYMLALADLSGSWRGHITEPDGTTPISLDKYPKFWLDGRAQTGQTPRVGLEAPRVAYQGSDWPGGFSWPIETAHHPTLCYLPYLVTGDRFYLDQMKFWANFCLLDTNSDLFRTQTRGMGWSIRDLADVAAYCPDADPMREYFRRRLQDNLDRLDAYARTFDGGPLEFLFPLAGNDGVVVTSLWANSYVAWALDHAAQQGFGPVAALRDRIVRTQVLFFSSEPDYPRSGGAPYYPVVGPATGGFFRTMREVYTATKASYTKAFGAADWERYAFPPLAGYYGPEARLMLQIGVRERIPGSQAALDYVAPKVKGDVDFRAGWAVQLPGVTPESAALVPELEGKAVGYLPDHGLDYAALMALGKAA